MLWQFAAEAYRRRKFVASYARATYMRQTIRLYDCETDRRAVATIPFQIVCNDWVFKSPCFEALGTSSSFDTKSSSFTKKKTFQKYSEMLRKCIQDWFFVLEKPVVLKKAVNAFISEKNANFYILNFKVRPLGI